MKLKKDALKKLKKTGGFTLIEMLIVVAIIAILVAVSIPMVANSLDKAKEATDTANERSAKSAALVTYMTGEDQTTGETMDQTTGNFYYDAVEGKLKSGSAPTNKKGYGQCKDHKGAYLNVNISENGEVTLTWSGDKSDPHSKPKQD